MTSETFIGTLPKDLRELAAVYYQQPLVHMYDFYCPSDESYNGYFLEINPIFDRGIPIEICLPFKQPSYFMDEKCSQLSYKVVIDALTKNDALLFECDFSDDLSSNRTSWDVVLAKDKIELTLCGVNRGLMRFLFKNDNYTIVKKWLLYVLKRWQQDDDPSDLLQT